ncbi:MAG: polysaccharide biosynthesis/export family protein [Gemmatimonadota bacterium]
MRGKSRGLTKWVVVVAGISPFMSPSVGWSQMVGPREAGRPQLQAMLDSLQRVAAGTRDDEKLRELTNQVSGLAYRMREGDVWPGDVVDLTVQGETKWTGQFTVTPGRQLELPDIDPIGLRGVLYSELEESIARQLAAYLREPRVRVQVLKRIGILGQVSNPGFYNVPGSALVSEALMLAGGPSSNAKVEKVKFRRFGKQIARGRPRIAFQNLSLDQLGVMSGDELYVPTASNTNVGKILLGLLGVAVSLTIVITRLSR